MKSNWIHSPTYDLVWFISPTILPFFIFLLLPTYYQNYNLQTWQWLVLVVCVDVSHVYSTLYRTYFRSENFQKHKALYIAAPAICLVTGILVYSLSEGLFWRCMAYLAVYHFVKQQYGFLRLYSKGEAKNNLRSNLYAFFIYAFTLLPILIWHTQGLKNFNWFTDADFLFFESKILSRIFQYFFFALAVLFTLFEITAIYRREFNLPRFLLIAGTALSWYGGIVYFEGDLTFTCLNVVAHGIPYMALIWITEKKQRKQDSVHSLFNSRIGLGVFISSLIMFAFVEEALWDNLVWSLNKGVFDWLYIFEGPLLNKALVFVVPLLSLPQLTHYILDGFIWKAKHN